MMVDDGVFTDPVEGGHVIEFLGYFFFPILPKTSWEGKLI